MPSSEPPDRAALGERLDAIFSFDVSSGRNYDELIEPLLDPVDAGGQVQKPGAHGPRGEGFEPGEQRSWCGSVWHEQGSLFVQIA